MSTASELGERKFTAGPWMVEDPMGPETLSIVSGGPEVYRWKHVAQVSESVELEDEEFSTVITRDEAKANAQLIGAAPDLLVALEDAYRFIIQPRKMWKGAAEYDTHNYNALTAKIRAAVAKALGDSP